MRARLTACAVVALFGLVGAAAAATPERVLARKSTTGGFADVRLSGSIANPTLVRIRVESTPAQPVQVTWTLRCTKGSRVAVRRGTFRATAPHTRRPLFPFANPARCGLGATVQLEREGTLTVTLLGR